MTCARAAAVSPIMAEQTLPSRPPGLHDASWDQDVPPVTACASCGQALCDGCAPNELEQEASELRPQARGTLPWERATRDGYLRALTLTALETAHPQQTCFAQQKSGSLLRALHFALVAETLAITSFALPWALGFCALFPELALRLLHSPPALALGALILSVLILGVVILHMVWGGALEWAIAQRGTPAAYALGQRFALYACGWDVLSSPAGLLLVSAYQGTAAARGALFAGIAVPRRALSAYLDEGRSIAAEQHRAIVRICFGLTSAVFFACLLGVPLALWLSL